MNPELDEDISIKYPDNENVIINKEIKVMELINKKFKLVII